MFEDLFTSLLAVLAALDLFLDAARVWLYNPFVIAVVSVLALIAIGLAAAHYLTITEVFAVYPEGMEPEKASPIELPHAIAAPLPRLDDDIKRVVELVLRARDERREGDWTCMHLSLSEAIHHAQLIEQATGCTA